MLTALGVRGQCPRTLTRTVPAARNLSIDVDDNPAANLSAVEMARALNYLRERNFLREQLQTLDVQILAQAKPSLDAIGTRPHDAVDPD